MNETLSDEFKCYSKPEPNGNYAIHEIPFSIVYKLNDEFCRGISYGSIPHRANVFGFFSRFLSKRFPDIRIREDYSIKNKLELYISSCPSYIDGPEVWNSKIIDHIIDECSDSDAMKTKKEYVRKRIIDVFHIEKGKHPRWLQNPNWPFNDGKPMQYIKTQVIRKGEWLQHVFEDPVSGKQRIIDDTL